MNPQQHELRTAANQTFLDALDHLRMSLEEVGNLPQTAQPAEPSREACPDASLDRFEQAAQDIEAFFQRRQQEK